nr:ABC transporter substrate-binding protein [Desulfobacterales bacterium]
MKKKDCYLTNRRDKTFFVSTAVFSLFFFLNLAWISGFAMASSRQAPLHLKIAAVDGHSTISMIKMFVEHPVLGENVVAEYESVRSPDLIAAKAISGEVDFIIVPTNMGAKLYNKGVPYKMAAITIWGNLYLVSSQNINTWQDLKDKHIYLHAQGLSPDVVFRFLLKSHGLNPEKDVNITYLTGPHALAMSFLGGKSKISMMPEPMLSKVMKRKPDTRIVFDLQKEWQKATGSSHTGFPQGSIMIKNSILKKYPDIANRFLNKYKESIAWVNA